MSQVPPPIKEAIFLTSVKVDDKMIIITHTMQGEGLAQQGYKAYSFMHKLDIAAAGKLAEALQDAIALIQQQHATQLPDKTYEPIAGRTNA